MELQGAKLSEIANKSQAVGEQPSSSSTEHPNSVELMSMGNELNPETVAFQEFQMRRNNFMLGPSLFPMDGAMVMAQIGSIQDQRQLVLSRLENENTAISQAQQALQVHYNNLSGQHDRLLTALRAAEDVGAKELRDKQQDSFSLITSNMRIG